MCVAFFAAQLPCFQDPPEYIVPDLKKFIKPLAMMKAEALQAEVASKRDSSNLSLKEREVIGLDFVEKVVHMFLEEGSFEEFVTCAKDKTAALLPYIPKPLSVSSLRLEMRCSWWGLGPKVEFRQLLDIAANMSTMLFLVAGSICKDFSSMGDGNRLVGKHVSHSNLA